MAVEFDELQQKCLQIGVEAMKKVQQLAQGDETAFQVGLVYVMRQLQDHLSISLVTELAARQGIAETLEQFRHG